MGIKRLLTTKDLCDIFDISKNTAYALMHSAAFPSMKVGRRLYVTEQALNEWLALNKHREFLL